MPDSSPPSVPSPTTTAPAPKFCNATYSRYRCERRPGHRGDHRDSQIRGTFWWSVAPPAPTVCTTYLIGISGMANAPCHYCGVRKFEHPTEDLPRCTEDEHFWPSHAPGSGPAVGAPCKCGGKTWTFASNDDEPFCRDCADENGICPHDGTPCGGARDNDASRAGVVVEPSRSIPTACAASTYHVAPPARAGAGEPEPLIQRIGRLPVFEHPIGGICVNRTAVLLALYVEQATVATLEARLRDAERRLHEQEQGG